MLGYLSNKVVGFKAGNFIKETPTQVFYGKYCESFKNNFSYRTPPVVVFFSL